MAYAVSAWRSQALTLFLATLAAAGPALAEVRDPTRPPAAFYTEAGQEAEARLAVTSVVLHKGEAQEGARARQPKAYAIVGGEVVKVGDRLDAGRVIRINERGVWLRTPAGVEHLELLPEVRRTPARKNTSQERQR